MAFQDRKQRALLSIIEQYARLEMKKLEDKEQFFYDYDRELRVLKNLFTQRKVKGGLVEMAAESFTKLFLEERRMQSNFGEFQFSQKLESEKQKLRKLIENLKDVEQMVKTYTTYMMRVTDNMLPFDFSLDQLTEQLYRYSDKEHRSICETSAFLDKELSKALSDTYRSSSDSIMKSYTEQNTSTTSMSKPLNKQETDFLTGVDMCDPISAPVPSPVKPILVRKTEKLGFPEVEINFLSQLEPGDLVIKNRGDPIPFPLTDKTILKENEKNEEREQKTNLPRSPSTDFASPPHLLKFKNNLWFAESTAEVCIINSQ